MAVIEFALIKLKHDYDELEFLDAVMHCFEIQDEWIRKHQPHLLKGRDGNLSTMHIARTDPAYLLITAPWDSPEGHAEWIRSEENQEAFEGLKQFFASGDDAVIYFHMSPAGKQRGAPPMFEKHRSFDVDRIYVPPEEKEASQAKYLKIEKALLDLDLEDHMWGGWRIEKSGKMEELVIFSSHSKFPLEQAVQKMSLGRNKESRCFHHIS